MSDIYRVLTIAGTLRSASLNKMLLDNARRLSPSGLELTPFDIADIPLFNQDIESAGYPDAVARLHSAVAATDGLVLAVPEYNHGPSGVLKNVLDWMSRPSGKSTGSGKPVLLVSVSSGASGGMRAQMSLRPTLSAMGMLQVTGVDLAIPFGAQAFASDGTLVDEKAKAGLVKSLTAFRLWIERLDARTSRS